MGFEILLPPANHCISTDHEEKRAFEDSEAIGPDMFNAFLLDSMGHVKLKWVDRRFVPSRIRRTNHYYLFCFGSYSSAPSTTRPRGPGKVRRVRFTQLLLRCLFCAAMGHRRRYKLDAQRNIDILQNVVRVEQAGPKVFFLVGKCGPAAGLPGNLQIKYCPNCVDKNHSGFVVRDVLSTRTRVT